MSITNPVGSERNTEHTGSRDLILSSFLRTIPGVRHLDIDMFQWCPTCEEPEFLMEDTASREKNTTMTRKLAGKLGVPTLLIRHGYNDVDHEGMVDLTLWEAGEPQHRGKYFHSEPWSFLEAMVLHLHSRADLHLPGCREVGELVPMPVPVDIFA